jgi:hypothetical protein
MQHGVSGEPVLREPLIVAPRCWYIAGAQHSAPMQSGELNE